MLSRKRVPSPVFIAHRIGPPPFWVSPFLLIVPYDRKYLPVTFKLQTVLVKPRLNYPPQFMQISLITPEDRHVIHVSYIMTAKSALSYHHIHGLQYSICKPLRCIRPDHDPVFNDPPYQIERPSVLNELLHPAHNDFRLQAVIKMPHIPAQLVPCTFSVMHHPLLYALLRMQRTSPFDTSTAVMIHASHHNRLEHLYQSMMDVLVRPLYRLTDNSPLPRARIISLRNMWLLLDKSVFYDLPEFFYPLLFSLIYPRRTRIALMTFLPVMGIINLINSL